MSERFVWGTRPCADIAGDIEGVEDTETGLFYGFTHPELLPFVLPESMKKEILIDFVINDGPNKYEPLP